MRTLTVLVSCLVLGGSARAQNLSEHQRSEMLDCTFHREGQWVDRQLYADGRVRFSYVYEGSSDKKPSSLYVAFWNLTKTEGKLLVFDVSMRTSHEDHFALVNDGWIKQNKGRLEVQDTLGGVYTYERIKGRLPTLEKRPLTVVALHQLGTTSAVCSTPLTK